MAPDVAAQVAPGDGSSKFARALASNSKKIRDGALASLARWLAARGVVEEADLMKVWKGMFYALWHADKAPVQARLRQLNNPMGDGWRWPPPARRLATSAL